MTRNHSDLLQASDNLSLFACVNYPNGENLLHALPIHERGIRSIKVKRISEHCFHLTSYPAHLEANHWRLRPGTPSCADNFRICKLIPRSAQWDRCWVVKCHHLQDIRSHQRILFGV